MNGLITFWFTKKHTSPKIDLKLKKGHQKNKLLFLHIKNAFLRHFKKRHSILYYYLINFDLLAWHNMNSWAFKRTKKRQNIISTHKKIKILDNNNKTHTDLLWKPVLRGDMRDQKSELIHTNFTHTFFTFTLLNYFIYFLSPSPPPGSLFFHL